jgi:Short C-terminal domain/Phospholipase_D-nuclease N-terminal
LLANPNGGAQVPIATEYPLLNIIWTMLVFFGLLIWLRLLFTVFADLFRRHDISGWSKAGWTLFAIVLPFVGVLIYLGTQGEGIAERNAELARAQKARLDDYVRETAGSSGATAEIAKAKELLDSGTISQAEFDRVKQKALS